MDKKVLKLLKKMSGDKQKNRLMIEKNLSFVLDTTDIEIILNYVNSSKIDNLNKIRFLTALFSEHMTGSNLLFVEAPKRSSELITKLLSECELSLYHEICELLNILCVSRYDFNNKSYNGESTMDIFTKMKDDLVSLFSTSTPEDVKIVNLEYKKVKTTMYKNFFKHFMSDHIDLEVDDLKEKVIEYYGDINYKIFSNTLLQESLIATDNDALNFRMYKKLLEIGADPNILTNSNRSLLDFIIKNDLNPEFFCEVLTEAYKYGFDINYDRTVIERLFYHCINIDDVIYFILSQGLLDIDFDIDSLVKSKWNIENHEAINLIINYMFCINVFDSTLKNLSDKDYKIEELKNICKIRGELWFIIDRICMLIPGKDEEEFAELWTNTIIENRKSSVNIIGDKITIGEILDALRTMLIKSVEDFDMEILKSKEKMLTYN